MRSSGTCPRELRAEAFSRFVQAGKLRVILFRLPPYVYPTRGSFEYLEWASEQLPDYRLAVESRNGRWMGGEHAEETLDFLKRHGMTYGCVDDPQGFGSSVPPVAAATADVAEVRFHGRNAATWEARGIMAAERFKDDYSPAELEEWVPRIDSLAESADDVHLMMNNCQENCGIRSAGYLADLLTDVL